MGLYSKGCIYGWCIFGELIYGRGAYQRDFTVFILCQWTYSRQITFHSYQWYNHVYLTRQVSYLCINISLLDDKFLVAVLFKTTNKFKNYFRVKDLVPETLRSNRFYKFLCGSCTASCVGKTDRHMKVRVSEHQGVSTRTGKPVKKTLSTSVRDQMLICDHQAAWEGFITLGNMSDKFAWEFKESLFIKRDKSILDRNQRRNCYYSSLPFSIILLYVRFVTFVYFTKSHMTFDYYYHGVNLQTGALPSKSLFSLA